MIRSEQEASYEVDKSTSGDDAIIAQALEILDRRLIREEIFTVTSPHDARDYLKLKLAEKEHEVFVCLFLDNRNQLIKYEELFRGTIDGASVYPREVVKRSLELNAAAVVFAHNHPSGVPEPSSADNNITIRLQKSLALVDIRVLDHLIVGGTSIVSLAERGVI